VDDISPSILADIENHATCTVDTLLKAFLGFCLPQGHQPSEDLVNKCLLAVLPICNADQRNLNTKGKKNLKQMETDADNLRYYLTK
jgi:hypothetical protein